MRGWAVWAATLAVVMLLNGIVWTLVMWTGTASLAYRRSRARKK